MADDQGMAAWIASVTTEQVMTMLSAAIRDRDWLAVEGAIKVLAVKDPVKAKTVYDTMLAAATTRTGGEGE